MFRQDESVGTKEILGAENVKMYFPIRKGIFRQVIGHVKAVDDVSVSVKKGETFGLVGESGSGKTTFGRVAVGLYKPVSGKIVYRSENAEYDISGSGKMPLKLRQRIQMIFQDPFSSLNPRLTVEQTLSEGLEISDRFRSKKEIHSYLSSLMEQVGLSGDYMYRFPHEFSGGQRQRIAIVRAMAMNPSLIVCDEPTSALDVSVQAQVVNLLKDFQKKLDLTYLFITHNIVLAKYVSDRIAVMYLGKMVEIAESEELFSNSLHPYTKSLLSAIPKFEMRDGKGKKNTLKGEIPSPINMPKGCRFRTRCPYAMDVCAKVDPPLVEGPENHMIACHLHGEKK